MQKFCEFCGNPIENGVHNQKYCCDNCKYLARLKRQREIYREKHLIKEKVIKPKEIKIINKIEVYNLNNARYKKIAEINTALKNGKINDLDYFCLIDSILKIQLFCVKQEWSNS